MVPARSVQDAITSSDFPHGRNTKFVVNPTIMSYLDFKTGIQRYLETHSSGAIWSELRDTLKLPYERLCPEWTHRLQVHHL